MIHAKEAYEESISTRETVFMEIMEKIDEMIQENLDSMSISYGFLDDNEFDIYADDVIRVLEDNYGYLVGVPMHGENVIEISWDLSKKEKKEEEELMEDKDDMMSFYGEFDVDAMDLVSKLNLG